MLSVEDEALQTPGTVRFPEVGTWGYRLSYPLLAAVLGLLALVLLVVGVACEAVGR